MHLTVQRRLAGQVLKCSGKRVVFDQASMELIKEAITKADIRSLVDSGAITRVPVKGVSRVRARKIKIQKSKGLRKGQGSRKGTANARANTKDTWIKKVRLQRSFIKELKDKSIIDATKYRLLYRRVKGGYFRNKRHIKLFLGEQTKT